MQVHLVLFPVLVWVCSHVPGMLSFAIGNSKTTNLGENRDGDFSSAEAPSISLTPPIMKVLSSLPIANQNDSNLENPKVWNDHQKLFERSGLFEGDILLPDSPQDEIAPRNSVRDRRLLWPNGVVPYFIAESLWPEGRPVILEAMGEIQSRTCVRFRPYRDGDESYVFVEGVNKGCYSYIGRAIGGQVLNLENGRCFDHGVAVHEMLHALGLYHQHTAFNRDYYIQIHWDNIEPNETHNFRVRPATEMIDLGLPYDYESIMHYDRKSFSLNAEDTITPYDPTANIAYKRSMSEIDVKKINIMYNCAE